MEMAQKASMKKKEKEKKKWKIALVFIQCVLVGIIIFNVGSFVLGQQSKYTSQDYWNRFPGLKQTYLDSQYANKNPKEWIPDEYVNAYAGGAYVQGVSPILIAPDTPPIGRYLIGLSVLFFKNEHIIILISACVSLIFLFLLGRQIFSYSLTALLVIALVSFEPIFKNQLIFTPLLDIIQLMFLTSSFYFFNRALSSKKYFWLFTVSSILWGLFIGTKFFATGITVIAAYYAVLLFHKDKKRLIGLTLSIPFGIMTYLLSYVQVFFGLGYNLKQFLGIQKWIFFYHKSQLILPFTIWPLILFNKWYVWYGNKPVISDSQWFFTWPIVLITSLATSVLYFFKKIKKRKEVEVLIAWIIFYILFFSIGQITTRYLIIYIPILYLVTFYLFENIFMHISEKREKRVGK